MSLPVLAELRTQLISAGNLIRAKNLQPSPRVVTKLKESFSAWKFKPACVEVTTTNNLVIVFPYEWFYLAAAAVPFYKALKEYKVIAMQASHGNVTTIEDARESRCIDRSFKESITSLLNGDTEDASKVEVFLTNYEAWGGGKSIARQQDDFHVSPILDALGLLAASSGYVVDLCAKLAELPDVSTALISHFVPADQSKIVSHLTNDFVDALHVCGFYDGEN